jgi:NHLM bacteriocin system ABC transporter ATP-binding protein
MDTTAVDLQIHFLAGGHLAPDDEGPFLLHGDGVWLVAAGQLDVFAVRIAAGQPVGPRTHLVQVREREAAFGHAGAAEDGWGLLAVMSSGGRIVRMSRREFEVRDRRHGGGAALLARWIDALYGAMACDKVPASAVQLFHGTESEVGPEQSIRVREDVAWVKHVAGHSRLMGREGLELNGDFIPISRRAWFQVGPPSRLIAVGMSALHSSEMWLGLDQLHDLVKRFIEASSRAADAAAHERMRQRGAFQQALLRDSCESLAATIDGASRARPPAPPDHPIAVAALDDPLFVACSMVGRALGVPVMPHPRNEDAPVARDRLGAILRASRIRARQVALAGEWWTEENGPLLGVRAADKLPVALLQDGVAGPYVLHDPRDRSTKRVDAAVAETLEPFACALYRPFPARSLRVRDVLRFAMRGSRRDAIVVVSMIVCAALVGMVPAVATGVLFDTVIPGAQRSQLVQMTFVLLACAVVSALFTVAQSIALLRIETRASTGLQAAVWDRLLTVPLPFFRKYTAGDLASRAMAVDGIRHVMSGPTVSALVGAVVALGNIVLMFWYSRTMALWATLIQVVVLASSLVGSGLQLRTQRAIARTQSRLAGLVLQLLTSIAKLRAAAAEVPAFALWSRQFSEQRRLQYRTRVVSNGVAAFSAAVPVLANLVIFALALPRITQTGELATGDFMAFLAAFTTSTTAILTGTPALVSLLNTIPLYEQAKPILETLPEVDVAKADPGSLAGDIEVQHATFRYHPDGPPILRDVSLRIQPGEFAAFVGPSGSGKSTLLRLLLGFEALEAGAIYYDGQEIGGLDVQALRRQMGVVLQSGRLMAGAIYRNIIGATPASLDDAWAAARMAGLAEDIEAMPMGMHTILSEGGGTLSGGQRQRLLIARALVGRPRILLFDEATSALDNRTQAIVSASLESLQATRIVIAHRLSTIVNAHRIYVMERGRIVQTGTYAELMSQTGPFAELARRQIA